MKICSECNIENDIKLFNKDGVVCKKCRRKKSSARYREKNRQKLRDYSKLYRSLNVDKYREYNRKWMKEKYHIYKDWVSNNKDRVNEIKRKHEYNKKSNNEIYKITRIVRSSIRSSIRSLNFKKKTKTSEIIGCTMEEFVIYIQSTFSEGMTLENYGEWHLDHIVPISVAKSYEDAVRLNHYTNFQALWAIDNLKKYNKHECK
jgi:hypothetical protein